MKYEIRFTGQFKKDLKLAKKQGKNLDELFDVVEGLANGETLEAKFRDHDLSGDYKGCRECHIDPDWLLIYDIFDRCSRSASQPCWESFRTVQVKLSLRVFAGFLQIQVAVDERGVVTVHSRRSVVKRSQQIRPNISDFRFRPLHSE